MVNKLKYNCIFGGGGIRGACYVGAIKALKEHGVETEALAGSSVGAVFALLYASGYDENEIADLFFDFNLNKFRDLNINIFDNDFSISKGEIFLDWLREQSGKKVFGNEYDKNKKVTFKDLKKDLYILTLDLNTNKPYVFSKKSTPDIEVAFAVRASAGLPGLMKPVRYNNMLLVDGDLIKSKPGLKIFPEFDEQNTRILEMRLEGTIGEGIKNPADYVNSIINTVWYLSTENIYENYSMNDKYDFIVFDTKDTVMFDFTAGKEKKEQLYRTGYITVNRFFNEILPPKKEKIYFIYSEILTKFNSISKEIKRNSYKTALKNLDDIIIYIYKNQMYTDKFLIKESTNLKEETEKAVKKVSFIHPKADNHKETAEKIEQIKDFLTERLDELQEFITENNNIT